MSLRRVGPSQLAPLSMSTQARDFSVSLFVPWRFCLEPCWAALEGSSWEVSPQSGAELEPAHTGGNKVSTEVYTLTSDVSQAPCLLHTEAQENETRHSSSLYLQGYWATEAETE